MHYKNVTNKITESGMEKIRFSGAQKSVFLIASSGKHCAPHNFGLLVMLGGKHVCLIVYLIMYQMK